MTKEQILEEINEILEVMEKEPEDFIAERNAKYPDNRPMTSDDYWPYMVGYSNAMLRTLKEHVKAGVAK